MESFHFFIIKNIEESLLIEEETTFLFIFFRVCRKIPVEEEKCKSKMKLPKRRLHVTPRITLGSRSQNQYIKFLLAQLVKKEAAIKDDIQNVRTENNITKELYKSLKFEEDLKELKCRFERMGKSSSLTSGRNLRQEDIKETPNEHQSESCSQNQNIELRLAHLENNEAAVEPRLAQLENKEVAVKEDFNDLKRRFARLEESLSLTSRRNLHQGVIEETPVEHQSGADVIEIEKTNIQIGAEFRNDTFAILNCLSVLYMVALFCGEKTVFQGLILGGCVNIIWESVFYIYHLNKMATEHAKLKALRQERKSREDIGDDNGGFNQVTSVYDVETHAVTVSRRVAIKWSYPWWHLLKVVVSTILSLAYLILLGFHLYQDPDNCKKKLFSIMERYN